MLWKGSRWHTNPNHAIRSFNTRRSTFAFVPSGCSCNRGFEVAIVTTETCASCARFLTFFRILFGFVVGDRELREYFVPRSLHTFHRRRGIGLGNRRNRRWGTRIVLRYLPYQSNFHWSSGWVCSSYGAIPISLIWSIAYKFSFLSSWWTVVTNCNAVGWLVHVQRPVGRSFPHLAGWRPARREPHHYIYR